MPEIGWFMFASLAALSNGLQGFFNKTAAEHRSDPLVVALAGSTVCYVLAGVSLAFTDFSLGSPTHLWILGTIGGVGFLLVTMSRLGALRALPSTVFFTLFRFNVVLVLASSLVLPEVFLGADGLTTASVTGAICVIVAGATLGFGGRNLRRRPHYVRGLILTMAAAVVSTVLYLSQKIAIDQAGIAPNVLIFVVNVEVAGLALAALMIRGPRGRIAPSLRNGASIGFYGYISFLCFLEAVRVGSLPLIVVVYSASFLIPILLSVWFYHEKVTRRQVVSVLVALFGLVLIHIAT